MHHNRLNGDLSFLENRFTFVQEIIGFTINLFIYSDEISRYQSRRPDGIQREATSIDTWHEDAWCPYVFLYVISTVYYPQAGTE